MRKFLFCIIIMASAVSAAAQITSREVRGVVQDSSGVPLVGVTVRLYAERDTMMASTNENGRFIFSKVASTNFKLTFSLIGFQLYERTYVSDVLLPITELVTVNLKEQPGELQEVVVYGVIPILVRPDTVKYNAMAYQVRDDALVEELLKQMPGFQVQKNGKVIAQGQQVVRVKVNGTDFFGGDLLTATRNLPAHIVEQIQLIDDYGDQASITGIKTGEPEKVINIVLKKDKNKGTFGQSTVSGGTEGRYLGSIAANRFNGAQQLSILGSINNTNTSLFSFGDVSGAGGRSAPDINSMIDISEGFNTVHSLGINFRDEIGDKLTLYGGYTYTERNNNTQSISGLQSMYMNRNIVSEDELDAVIGQKKHSLAWNMEVELDSLNYLKISPSLSYTSNNTLNNSFSTITYNNVSTIRDYNTTTALTSPNLNVDVLYNHRFNKQGRNLSVNAKVEYMNSDRQIEMFDFSRVVDYQYIVDPVRSTDSLGQNQLNYSHTAGVSGNISYIEPINIRSYMEFLYEFNSTDISNDRRVYNLQYGSVGRQYVDTLSVDYSYLFQTSQFGLHYHLNGKKTKYILGFAVQPTDLNGNTASGDVATRVTRINFVPSMRFQYQLNNSSNLSLTYRGQNNQPGFLQVLPIRDESNPQFIMVGNPNLRAEFMSSISMQYRNFSIQTGNSFFMNLNYTHVRDKVVSNRFIIPNSTRQETNYLNAQGYYDLRGYYHFSAPLAGGVMTLNLSGSADYSHNISFINDVRNLGRNTVLSQNVQLLFQLEDYLEADLRGAYNTNRTNFSVPPYADIEAAQFAVGFGSRSYLKDNWIFSFDFAQQINTGYINIGTVNPTLLNVYIEKSFLKNEMASIRLQGYDLFNQNTGISRQVNGNDIFDVRSNRLGRYFLLSFNFRFQKFPPKG